MTASRISSAIRQKGESQNGGKRKQSTPNFLKNEQFLSPYQGVKNFRFSKNLVSTKQKKVIIGYLIKLHPSHYYHCYRQYAITNIKTFGC